MASTHSRGPKAVAAAEAIVEERDCCCEMYR